MKNDSPLGRQIQKLIKFTRKEITILFTDMEGSGSYWDKRGDKMGRLMVDTHNRLIFPIVKKFRGKVVKTIGDALMVSFRKPVNALKAAVAIQQTLRQERQKNPKFPKVRIGIHTGKAVMERSDVFGDMVNVASRIQAKAKGDEILLSAWSARKIPRKKFELIKNERFRPKGKRNEITIFKCQWRRAPVLVKKRKFGSRLVFTPLQKLEIAVSALSSLAVLAWMYMKYVRYLFSDSERLTLYSLDLIRVLPGNRLLMLLCTTAIVSMIVFFLRKERIPVCRYQCLYGGLGFCIGFLLFDILTTQFGLDMGIHAEKVLYHSDHIFIEVMVKQAPIHEEPNIRSAVIRTLPRGFLLLLADVNIQGSSTWDKVLIGRRKWGWILRIRPPGFGIPEERITLAEKFYFKWKDVYHLIVGFIGFAIGFFRFKIRPA